MIEVQSDEVCGNSATSNERLENGNKALWKEGGNKALRKEALKIDGHNRDCKSH